MGAGIVASIAQGKYTIKMKIAAALKMAWDTILGIEHVLITLFAGIPLFLGLRTQWAQICSESLFRMFIQNEMSGLLGQGSAV